MSLTDNFKGLPMSDLISAPLNATADSQIALAGTTTRFIKSLLHEDTKKPMTVDFSHTVGGKEVMVSAPLLAIVNIPSLAVKNCVIDFNMEVKSATKDTSSKSVDVNTEINYKSFWSPVSAKINATVSSKNNSERSTDNSAKYTVHVEAIDNGPPEGLSRMLDILQSSIPNPSEIQPSST